MVDHRPSNLYRPITALSGNLIAKERKGISGRLNFPSKRRLLQSCDFMRILWLVIWLVAIGAGLTGCSPPDQEGQHRQALDQSMARLQSCAPAPGPTGPVKLAIQSIQNEPQATLVRLVAYTTEESADFILPMYTPSRGRWLIGEIGRAYLLDQDCREYKLNDQRVSTPLPQPGRVQLARGQACEVTLKFPPLSARARLGVLVYADQVLPTSFPATAK